MIGDTGLLLGGCLGAVGVCACGRNGVVGGGFCRCLIVIRSTGVGCSGVSRFARAGRIRAAVSANVASSAVDWNYCAIAANASAGSEQSLAESRCVEQASSASDRRRSSDGGTDTPERRKNLFRSEAVAAVFVIFGAVADSGAIVARSYITVL